MYLFNVTLNMICQRSLIMTLLKDIIASGLTFWHPMLYFHLFFFKLNMKNHPTISMIPKKDTFLSITFFYLYYLLFLVLKASLLIICVRSGGTQFCKNRETHLYISILKVVRIIIQLYKVIILYQ